jgi:hypothetical protein
MVHAGNHRFHRRVSWPQASLQRRRRHLARRTLVLKLLSTPAWNRPSTASIRTGSAIASQAGGASNGGAVLRQFFDDRRWLRRARPSTPPSPARLDYLPLPKPGERFPLNDPQLRRVSRRAGRRRRIPAWPAESLRASGSARPGALLAELGAPPPALGRETAAAAAHESGVDSADPPAPVRWRAGRARLSTPKRLTAAPCAGARLLR